MLVTIDELRAKVGSEVGVSEWMRIDQEMINQFAKITADDQFQHIDPERAKATQFGGTIAHGMLTLSLLRAMYESCDAPALRGTKIAVSYGANRLRFTAPVPSGGRVRGHFKLISLEEKDPKKIMETFEFMVEIEGQERPALIAEWLIQIVL